MNVKIVSTFQIQFFENKEAGILKRKIMKNVNYLEDKISSHFGSSQFKLLCKVCTNYYAFEWWV